MRIRLKVIVLLIFAVSQSAFAQRGYTEQIRVEGLQIGTKWGKAKDESGTKRTALLISVVNTENQPVNYGFNILFYFEGILRETATIEPSCIDGLKSKVGKITGTYFIPSSFTDEQLKSSDFGFELDQLFAEKVDSCTTEAK